MFQKRMQIFFCKRKVAKLFFETFKKKRLQFFERRANIRINYVSVYTMQGLGKLLYGQNRIRQRKAGHEQEDT